MFKHRSIKGTNYNQWTAAIAPWYRLCLPFCGCRFKSQAHHLCFYNLYYWNWNVNLKWLSKNEKFKGVAVAQWIRLHLPFCHPGSRPKHTPSKLLSIFIWIVSHGKDENKQKKKRELDHIFLQKMKNFFWSSIKRFSTNLDGATHSASRR